MMSPERRKTKPSSTPQPSLLRVFGLCLLPVVALFLGYEVIERTWLKAVDPEALHVLHIVRGLSAAAVASALATLVLVRQLQDPETGKTQLSASARPWQQRLQHVRMRTKIVVPMVALAVVPALFIGIFTISSSRASLHETAIQRVKFHAASKAKEIRGFLQIVQDDLHYLAQMKGIRALASSEASSTADETAALRGRAEEELTIFAQGKRAYFQVRYLDGHGREVIRLNVLDGQVEVIPPERLQDKSERYYVREALALAPGTIYISPMDLNIEHGRVEVPLRGVVRYAAPVAGRNGRGRGLVVINLYADYIMSLLAPLPDETEAWLVDQSGSYMGFVGKSTEKREFYGLKNRRRLSEDYSQTVVASVLSSPPVGSVIETTDSFLSAVRIAHEGMVSDQYWTLLIAYSRTPIDTAIRHFTIVLSAVMIFALAVAGMLGLLVGSYVARPIARLRSATREIAAGDLSKRVDVATGDELEALAYDFNVMTERLRNAHERLSTWNEELEQEVARQTDELHEQQTALARADKMASIGQMTAGVMHEVGNPLAAIKTKIQVAQEEDALCEKCHNLVSEILTEVDRLVMFLRSFSRLARMREPQMGEVSVAEVVHSVTTLVIPALRRKNMQLRVDAASNVPNIRGDAEQLRHLLINLILNAMEASSTGSEIVVRIRDLVASSDRSASCTGAVIEVVDQGAGISEEIVGKIWDPFFTTRAEGTGLGLSICRRIVEDHAGTIEIHSELGEGTIVRMTFPVYRADASKRAGSTEKMGASKPEEYRQ